MHPILAILEAVIEFALLIMEAVDASRARDFRRRLGDNPCGVLMEQLNPNGDTTPITARSELNASSDSGRGEGNLDK